MKSLVTVLFGCLLSNSSFATDLVCPAEVSHDGLESAIQWVTDATTCDLAVKRAEACAQWGSTADGSIVAPAAATCYRELDAKNPTEEDLKTLQYMANLCYQKYPRESGTMWTGARGFCYIKQIRNMTYLKTSIEEALREEMK